MKTLVAVPCLDMLPMLFVKSLIGMQAKGEIEVVFSANSLVYDSRNGLARRAIENNFDRVLWFDSDMVFDSDIFARFSEHLDNGTDFVSGLYNGRKEPFEPVIYSSIYEENGIPKADVYKDHPNELFEIAGCGFGAVMMNVSLLKAVAEKFGFPFSPVLGFGEDLSFCLRAHEAGYKLYCDPTIKCGHIGQKIF